MKKGMERRYVPARELRVEGDASEIRIAGYAAVTGAWSDNLGGFQEIIEAGAFGEAIGVSDVRLQFNHDGIALARCRMGASDGTMRIEEDDTGLHFDATMDGGSPAVQTLASAIRRADVDQCSFSFLIAEGDDRWVDDGKVMKRTIVRVAELFDVGPVNFPAYPDTTVALRSRDAALAAQRAVAPGGAARVKILRRRLALDT
jgi:HK97 family phage prohead protease